MGPSWAKGRVQAGVAVPVPDPIIIQRIPRQYFQSGASILDRVATCRVITSRKCTSSCWLGSRFHSHFTRISLEFHLSSLDFTQISLEFHSNFTRFHSPISVSPLFRGPVPWLPCPRCSVGPYHVCVPSVASVSPLFRGPVPCVRAFRGFRVPAVPWARTMCACLPWLPCPRCSVGPYHVCVPSVASVSPLFRGPVPCVRAFRGFRVPAVPWARTMCACLPWLPCPRCSVDPCRVCSVLPAFRGFQRCLICMQCPSNEGLTHMI